MLRSGTELKAASHEESLGRRLLDRCPSCSRLVVRKRLCAHCLRTTRALLQAEGCETEIRAELYPRIDRIDVRRVPALPPTAAVPSPVHPVAAPSVMTLRRVDVLGSSLPSPSPAAWSDEVVAGRYLLGERLGRGATATVFRAQDLLAQREVALKILHPALGDDDIIANRFRREARTMERLQHRNTVRALGHGNSDAVHYIAMEYVAGHSLRSLIADAAPVDPQRVVDIAAQLLEGVKFLHGQGIVHRDLKPENVILSLSGVVKITDFGIVWAGPAAGITPAGTILGTAPYLPPERLMAQECTSACDLYAIGVIVYELLTGQLPVSADSVPGIAMKHLTERPVPPSQMNSAVPPALDEIVMQALEKSPSTRFTDAERFLAAVARQASHPAVKPSMAA